MNQTQETETANDSAATHDERGPGTSLGPGPSANPPVFQEELGDVKAVSAPAASPIRCETSLGRDRISELPRYGSRPPGGGRDPSPASPDHTKHIARKALRVPRASGLPPYRPRCGEGPGRPGQAFFAPSGFSGNRSPGNPR